MLFPLIPDTSYATHSQRLERIAQSNGIPVETCFIRGKAHCGAYACDARRYDQATYRFLARHLGTYLPVQHHESVTVTIPHKLLLRPKY